MNLDELRAVLDKDTVKTEWPAPSGYPIGGYDKYSPRGRAVDLILTSAPSSERVSDKATSLKRILDDALAEVSAAKERYGDGAQAAYTKLEKSILPALKDLHKLLTEMTTSAQEIVDSQKQRDAQMEGNYLTRLRMKNAITEAVMSVVKVDDSAGNENESDPKVIAQLREIVRSKQAKKIGGIMVDMFSANAAVQIYDGLNAENKAKMGSLPLKKMMDLVIRMIGKTRAAV